MSPQRTPVTVPLAAGVVLVVVVVILAGLFLVRRGETPTTTPSAAVAAATSTSPPLPTSAPTTVSAATPTTALPTAAPRPTTLPAPTSVPPPTVQPTAPPTPGSSVNAVIALVNGTPQIFPAGAAIPTTPPANWWNDVRPVDPALADEVGRAFNRFWEVRVQASFDLNPEPLPQVMAGAALQRELTAIEKMRSENRAAQMKVDHRISILHAGPDEAAVEDDYAATLVYVDAETKEPVQPTPVGRSQYAYRLRKTDGVWRVVDNVRLVDG